MEAIKVNKMSVSKGTSGCFICLQSVAKINPGLCNPLDFFFNYLEIKVKFKPVVCEKCGQKLREFEKLGTTLKQLLLAMEYLLGFVQKGICNSNREVELVPLGYYPVREDVLRKCGEKMKNPARGTNPDRGEVATQTPDDWIPKPDEYEDSNEDLVDDDGEEDADAQRNQVSGMFETAAASVISGIQGRNWENYLEDVAETSIEGGTGDICSSSENNTKAAATTPAEKKTRVKCLKCSKIFCNRRYLKLHNAAVHVQLKPCKCPKCGKEFSHSVYLWKHDRQVHLNPKPERSRTTPTCTVCSKRFKTNGVLKTHMNTVHLKLRPFKCSKCDKSFTDNSSLEQHINAFHLNLKPYMCDLCGKTFASTATLRVHKSIPHEPKPQLANSKSFSCPKCPKVYSTSKQLNKHHRYYHLRNGFKCDFCEKKYRLPIDLKRHVESFHEKIRHPCQVEGCGKDYATGKFLRSHYRTEHPDFIVPGPPEPPKKYLKTLFDGAYVFECKICDKQYKSADSVNGHIKAVHEPKTTFVCEICGYSTASKQTFRNHVKTQHDSIAPESGPVLCEFCSEPFTSMQYLNLHIRHKHKEFKCQICDKTFNKREHLTRHVSGVHEKERHHCQVEGCDSSYSQESDLLKHYKSQHPDFTTVPKKRGPPVSKYADMFTRTEENGESIFECKLCESESKKFKHLQSIQLHIRNVHGRIDSVKK